MKLTDLQFEYPEELVAQTPKRPSRVLWVDSHKEEISLEELLDRIPAGDILVVNNTKVEPRRVFGQTQSGEPFEVLFVHKKDDVQWQVMCPVSRLGKERKIQLPGEIQAEVTEGGRPQTVKLSRPLDSGYFEKFGEMPLPPYIQKARKDRHTQSDDPKWYQTAWAQVTGSSAAPTASLHFEQKDIERLKGRGVNVVEITLHVGLGTYLPVQVQDLKEHPMHEELVEISKSVIEQLSETRRNGGKVWSMGTTVARALESQALGVLKRMENGGYRGGTRLLILEPSQFRVVDRLLTNFHQPESTLLALVMAFAGRNKVLEAYQYAIEKRFRLFSYGDLSVWIR